MWHACCAFKQGNLGIQACVAGQSVQMSAAGRRLAAGAAAGGRPAGRAWPCPYLLLFTYTQTTTHTPTHATALPADSSADADGRGGAVSRALYEGWRRRGQWARVCRLEEVLGAALPGSGTCVKQAMLLLLLMAFGMLTMPTALLLLLLLLLLMAMGVGLWHAGHACAAAASSAAAPTAAPRSPHGRMWWPAAC